MFVCVCVYPLYVCVYVYVWVCFVSLRFVWFVVCMYVRFSVLYVFVCMFVCMYVSVFLFVCISGFLYVPGCTLYLCLYV